MPYVGKKPADIIATSVDTDTGAFSGNVTAGGTLGVTGETTLATHLNLGDNDKIKLGASGDLEIFHDGTNSNLKDTGTGSLNLIASTKVQVQGVNGETMAIFNEDGSAELRHNDVKKFETTSSGVTVTGDIANASGDLTVDVAGDIILDADGGDIKIKDGGTEFGSITNSSSELHIKATVNDKDIVLAGLDGGAACNALRLDMSAGGAATLNNGLTLADGNLVVASGHGIDFSANSGQSGQSSEIFHHYEEGAFTPQAFSNTTEITCSAANGYYTKVGDRVFISGSVTRNDSASLTGSFFIKSLPFASSSNTGNFSMTGGFWFDKASAADVVAFGFVDQNSTQINPKSIGDFNDSVTYMTANQLENGRPVYFSASYRTTT